MSGACERANGQANGPVLTSGSWLFWTIVKEKNDCVYVFVFRRNTWRDGDQAKGADGGYIADAEFERFPFLALTEPHMFSTLGTQLILLKEKEREIPTFTRFPCFNLRITTTTTTTLMEARGTRWQ